MQKSNMGAIYKQIKEDIVEDILSSVYTPGDMIPTQADYARKYNVSRLTVRKAIDDLVFKGILRSEKGKGTFVCDIVSNTYSYRRLTGFTSNVVSKKVKTNSKILSIQEIKADKRLSVKLNIPPESDVILIERLRYTNNICVSFQRSFLAKHHVSNINFYSEDLEFGSLYEILQKKAGFVMTFVDEHIRAIRATEQIAKYFDTEEGDPVLFTTRVVFNSQNEPVEYCENYDSSDVNGIWVKSLNI